mgnify:CR=1 FL=1
MMNQPEHESASEMTKEMNKPRAMKVESVTIRPAENGGFIATCSKRPKNKADGEMPMGMYESKDYAFTSLPDVQAFVARELGGELAPEPEIATEGEESYEDQEAV